MASERQWRVGPLYWRDGHAGSLIVGYIGFDLASGAAIDSVPCSIKRLNRIADYAGVDRDAFVDDVVVHLHEHAHETAAEWEHRSSGTAAAYATFARGRFLFVSARPGNTMRDHLAYYVRNADGETPEQTSATVIAGFD